MSEKQPMILFSDITVTESDDGLIELNIPRIRVWSYADCDDTIIEFANDGYDGALDHELPVLAEMLNRMAAGRARIRARREGATDED